MPLGLSEWSILKQEWQENGTIRVEVIAATSQAICPPCQKTCVKLPDTRARKKRDMALREYQVELIVYKRRFRCFSWKTRFPEPDPGCGKRRRTTQRFGEAIGKQASTQPVAPVANAAGVSHHLVQNCFETVATQEIEQNGRGMKEQMVLSPPRFLGRDAFATRKRHRSDTIFCDLEARRVREVRAGRKREDVAALLGRVSDPDAVKALSMDMSASLRPAVQLCVLQAQIVVDHFHVLQHVMKGFKKELSSWAHKNEGKPLLEGKQHRFLKGKEDLPEEQSQERTQLGEHLPFLEVAWPT